MPDSELRCGAYEGRSFIAPDNDGGAVAYVDGEPVYELVIEPINDLLWHEDAA